LLAACFLFLHGFASEPWAAQQRGVKPDASTCAVAQSAPAQVKSKPKPKPKSTPPAAAKSKNSAQTKKKAKQVAAKPLVSAATKTKAEAITSEISPALPEDLENEIAKFFGLRYRFGGEGQSGFDCSGLIRQVYSEVFGINLPRSSREQSRLGGLESVGKDDLKTGDLVFFGPGRKSVNHVGMYLAGGHFLHASRSEGVTISRLDEGYWKARYMFSKRARGLELQDEPDDATDLTQALVQDSFNFTLDLGDSAERFSYLEAGIQINDSLEFLLSGFFLNALDAGDTHPGPDSPAAPQTSSLTETDGGFRLAAILSPLEWIKLIPSVTQVEDENAPKSRDRDYQKFGLETWMILPSSRVAVFMAAHAKNQEDFFEQPLGVSPDWQTMDFALGLHYHLSESLRFSLYGTQAFNPDLRPNEDAGRRSTSVEDVSFELNIRF
jgi:lipoprotein Spr/probable lipoprotein NlpC